MSESNTDRLWTADEVADFLGMHVQTVYAKAKAGEIPSFKIGAKRRFRRAEVEAWLEAQASPSLEPTLYRSVVSGEVVHRDDLSVCNRCGGTGEIQIYQTEDRTGRLVVDSDTCPDCGGIRLVEDHDTLDDEHAPRKVEPIAGPQG